MQAIYVQRGDAINYTPAEAVAAGQVVVQNGLVGVARTPIAANALGSLAVVGLFKVAKANLEINGGAAIYWDADGDPVGGTAGTGCATTSAEGNTFMGFSTASAGASDAEVYMRLFGVSVSATIHNPVSAVIADPGDAGAIPVTESGHVALVTADAETRTLAAPTYAGQTLVLSLKTDGGDCVVAFNTTATATFDDAGDTLMLVAIENGENLEWAVVGNSGVTVA